MSSDNVNVQVNTKSPKADKGHMKFKGKKPDKKEDVIQGRVVESSSVVYRAPGVSVTKYTNTNYPQAIVLNVKYVVLFEGHEAIEFTRMGEAVERAKNSAPEKVTGEVKVEG